MLSFIQENTTTNVKAKNMNSKFRMTNIFKDMSAAWKIIAPLWPLQTYIARNPLVGLQDLTFIEALNSASKYFDDLEIPEQMLEINRQTIKWCQAFFDLNQATITMPLRNGSLFLACKELAMHDFRLHLGNKININWLKSLPSDPFLTISICLEKIGVKQDKYEQFFTLMLVMLPGWSGHVKYIAEYCGGQSPHGPVALVDYMALRLLTTCLLWPKAADILSLKLKANNVKVSNLINTILSNESKYQAPLLSSLSKHAKKIKQTQCDVVPEAQLFFCIDVRSESFRRSIEAEGNYETFGYAGFFGLPISILNYATTNAKASCPVLIKPSHTICQEIKCSHNQLSYYNSHKKILSMFRSIYKTLKYGFTTPFVLVEVLGPIFGIFMALKTICSSIAAKSTGYFFQPSKLKFPEQPSKIDILNISFAERCQYAKSALVMTGLVDKFAPVVLLCGHKSCTENNAYASSLDCGACGGNSGGTNAQVLASILNDKQIREYLIIQHISIPASTVFIAAEHNTTTDEVVLFDYDQYDSKIIFALKKIKNDLLSTKIKNNFTRSDTMNLKVKSSDVVQTIHNRSIDWSQTRPEWGLAKNASFIIGPRNLTKDLNLESRAFLHSYDWTHDKNGSSLETILTAPMIVAQWINSQYLFSTANNVAYGGGSKVTQNITGNIGIMQGNASDLMHGLPLQSVCSNDANAYHELLRLITIVYAPISLISIIISKHEILQQLFSNGWVSLAAIDPENNKTNFLNTDLSWRTEL